MRTKISNNFVYHINLKHMVLGVRAQAVRWRQQQMESAAGLACDCPFAPDDLSDCQLIYISQSGSILVLTGCLAVCAVCGLGVPGD
jgi:hypothetical protein